MMIRLNLSQNRANYIWLLGLTALLNLLQCEINKLLERSFDSQEDHSPLTKNMDQTYALKYKDNLDDKIG